MLPPAPPAAGLFLMSGPLEVTRGRAVPAADRLPAGALRDAVRAVRKTLRVYDETRLAGRGLLDQRQAVHAQDERDGASALGAGKAMPDSRLVTHDAELADMADRLSAAAGAVVNAMRELESLPDEIWAGVGDRIDRQVCEHVGAAQSALAQARSALEAAGAIAELRTWTRRRMATGPDQHVAAAIDALDRAQEKVAVVRDGEPAPDLNLIAAPAHHGSTSAWREAVNTGAAR